MRRRRTRGGSGWPRRPANVFGALAAGGAWLLGIGIGSCSGAGEGEAALSSTRAASVSRPLRAEDAIVPHEAVAGEHAFDAPLGPRPAPQNGGTLFIIPTGIATNGLFYVFWSDGRRTLLNRSLGTSSGFVARIDPSTGRPISAEPSGHPFTTPYDSSTYQPFAVSADGASTLLAAWHTNDSSGGALRVARLGIADALPLSPADEEGLVVYRSLGSFGNIQSIATWDGHLYTLFIDDDSSAEIRTLRFDPALGAALPADGSGVPLTAGTTPWLGGDLGAAACDPTGVAGCLYVGNGTGGYLLAAHYDSVSGVSDAPITLALATSMSSGQQPNVAWDGARFLVTGESGSCQFVSPTTPLTTGAAVNLFGVNHVESALFDGTRYVVDFGGSVDTFLPNVDTTHVKQMYGAAFSALGGSVNGTSLGLGVVAASFDLEGITSARFLDATGVVPAADQKGGMDGVYFDVDANYEEGPALTSDGNGHAWVAWLDNRNQSIFYADQANEPITTYAAPIDLTSGAAGTLSTMATAKAGFTLDVGQLTAAASDGTFGLLFAVANAGLAAERVNAAGAVTESATLALPSGIAPIAVSNLAVTFGGGVLLVAVTSGTALFVETVNPATLAPSEAGWITLDENFNAPYAVGGTVAIAYGGSNFYVVWPSSANNVTNVVGARIGTDGTMLDDGGRALGVTLNISGLAVACHAGGYLVTWSDQSVDFSTYDLLGARVGSDGMPLPTSGNVRFPIITGAGDQMYPQVVDSADGLNYQLVWEDSRNGNLDIYGTLVQYDGTARDSVGVPIASSSDDEGAVQMVSTGPGQLFVLYNHVQGVPRLASRTLTTGAKSGTCTTSQDCDSLVCRDGFCCDTPCDGACQTCAAVPGTCTSVRGQIDPDSCSGASVCNASGQCSSIGGKMCSHATDCASGFCVDGVCCDSACDGVCASCNATPGICTPAVAGSSGREPSCLPYSCDGASYQCPTGCQTDSDCTRPFTCDSSGVCQLSTSGSCVDGETLKASNGTLSKCEPYLCTAGKCGETCASIADCAAGYVCSDESRCVTASSVDLASGCALGPRSSRDGGWGWGVTAIGGLVLVRRRRRISLAKRGARG